MTKYKITTTENKTYGGCQWTPGEWQETSGTGRICTEGWLHCYHHPLLAALMNPLYSNFKEPYKLWEVEVEGKFKECRGLGCGYSRMRLIQEIEVPDVSTKQRIAFGILCAKHVCDDQAWNKWADGWLSGKDGICSAAVTSLAATHAAFAAAHEHTVFSADDYFANSATLAVYASALHVSSAEESLDFLIECAKKAMEVV